VEGKNDNIVQSVDRAVDILECLSEEKEGCGITFISKSTGLHKSTVHRLLGTLMNKGYVEKDMENDNYRLGTKILYLASSVLDRMDIRNVSRPYIRELSEETKEVVHLSILDGDEAVYIDKMESARLNSVRMHSQIGKRVPLYCTAVGKVLLSKLDEDKVKHLLGGKKFVKFMPNTIDNVEDFIKQLEEVREKGYATDEMEHEEGIRCIAAPIFDRKGKVAAAVSLSGPIFYITEERIPFLRDRILKASEGISYQLGFIKNFKK
jgi:IclR family transcriptional regulator, KDG regulon repressor